MNHKSLKLGITLPTLVFCICFIVYPQSKDSTLRANKEIRTTITYCNLEVPEFWKQANADFYLMYYFKVNEKGEISDIKKIRDDMVGEDKVAACITDWKIGGFSDNTELVVSFKWQHGRGWVEQTIFGKGFKQTTNMENIGY